MDLKVNRKAFFQLYILNEERGKSHTYSQTRKGK